jgi:hypothetical protein
MSLLSLVHAPGTSATLVRRTQGRARRVRESGHEPRSCPNEPTVHTLNDALFAQFATIRSVAVKTCDYGSGGRGFESLPARNPNSASQHHLGGRFSRSRGLCDMAFHRVGVTIVTNGRRSTSVAMGLETRWTMGVDRLPSGSPGTADGRRIELHRDVRDRGGSRRVGGCDPWPGGRRSGRAQAHGGGVRAPLAG